MSLGKKSAFRKSKTRHKKWFDTSLQELRKALECYSRHLSKDPFNKQLREQCFKICKKYHRLRHKKRRNSFNGFMNKLDTLRENNHKQFEKILNSMKTEISDDDNSCINAKELEGKPSETDSIKFKILSKTTRGKKDSTKRHHHRHHKRQPGEQQFPIQVVTG